jgi:lipopolysaccharide transport system ATP-binding protein
VGTGFHQELTGRENVFLNGAILGMSREEVRRKFDEIVDFSGVGIYIDTPVKRYSSGMYVRLAFAVAAFLEPEILVVDEVLAVGDYEFQKKCIGRMQDVSSKHGRTVLFVSHNMTAVRQLCTEGLLLKNGRVEKQGMLDEVIRTYQQSNVAGFAVKYSNPGDSPYGNTHLKILEFFVRPLEGDVLRISSGIFFQVSFMNFTVGENMAITFELRNLEEVIVFHHGGWICTEQNSRKGIYTISSRLPPHTLNAGSFKFSVIIATSLHIVLYKADEIVQFEVQNESLAHNLQNLPGVIRPDLEYTIAFES